MKGLFLFLGTSASAGVPMIGCKCAVCTSSYIYDKRLRPSGYIEVCGKRILLDVGPDFRQQALQHQIDHLDGLLLTHTHYDHIAGIDELRLFYLRQKKPLPCLLSQESFDEIKNRYAYLFRSPAKNASLTAQLDFQILTHDFGETEFLGVKIGYLSFTQGGTKVNGFRIGDFAYVSDIREYEDAVFDSLKGVRTLVLSALKSEPSPLHLSFQEAVDFAKRVHAKETWLTHIGHFLNHENINASLPSNVRAAYDGLKLEFQCTN